MLLVPFILCLASLPIGPVFADFSIGENLHLAIKRHSEAENIANLKKWIEDTRSKPLPNWCHGTEQGSVSNEELFVRNAPCHEKEAFKRLVTL